MFLSILFFVIILDCSFLRTYKKISVSIFIQNFKIYINFERIENFNQDNFCKYYIRHTIFTFISLSKILSFPLYMYFLFSARLILFSFFQYYLRLVHCFCFVLLVLLSRLPHKLITHSLLFFSFFISFLLSIQFLIFLLQFSLKKELKDNDYYL